MKVDLGIWDKLTRAVVVLLLLAGVGFAAVGFAVWYLPLIRQNERMRSEILTLDRQIQQEAETSRRLKASLDALHHDPKTVERMAREKFGYARPDETVVRFEAPATNNPPPR